MRRICKWEDREEAAVIARGAVAAAIQFQDQAEDIVWAVPRRQGQEEVPRAASGVQDHPEEEATEDRQEEHVRGIMHRRHLDITEDRPGYMADRMEEEAVQVVCRAL